jgi:hypothetical protein
MNFTCNCHNSGTNSFTGKCSNCGMTKPSQETIVTLNSTPYKTIHENDVMINLTKKELERDSKEIRKILYQNSIDDSYSINFENIDDVIERIANLPKKDKETIQTKQSIYNQIRFLVNTQSNDMLLGKAVRKLFL